MWHSVRWIFVVLRAFEHGSQFMGWRIAFVKNNNPKGHEGSRSKSFQWLASSATNFS
jgi:hypothetical protein